MILLSVANISNKVSSGALIHSLSCFGGIHAIFIAESEPMPTQIESPTCRGVYTALLRVASSEDAHTIIQELHHFPPCEQTSIPCSVTALEVPDGGHDSPVTQFISLCLEIDSLEEQVNCSVCLDSLNHSLWIRLPCSHCFHGSCLVTWHDTSPSQPCPLCRRTPVHSCDTCGRTKGTRVCLVCGISSCRHHAKQHATASGHSIAMIVDERKVENPITGMEVSRVIDRGQKGPLELQDVDPASAFVVAGESVADTLGHQFDRQLATLLSEQRHELEMMRVRMQADLRAAHSRLSDCRGVRQGLGKQLDRVRGEVVQLRGEVERMQGDLCQ
eukprot:gnl/Dysnectes_brevis/5199_a7373_583.p1 GENE.gnl/Dysnectes_brevis/5199_a7373_583~~gnl/Dysnectes_brevis/5199_a7373_583.p1  ORF type:complete len:330 (-),score=106.26 gnl/Dysnectes_brevis/5199_a7373_583:63-1052(-)